MIWTYSQMNHTDKYSKHSSIIWPVWLNGWVFDYELSGCGFESSCSYLILDFTPASSMEFLDIQATIKCGFTLTCVRNMISTYGQMHRTDKYSQHSSIIWSVGLNGWAIVYEVNGKGFQSSCNVEMLVCFICVGTRDRILNDINHDYQIMMNQHKKWT